MKRDDGVYIRQMIDHAGKAVARAERRTRQDVDLDEDFRYVLLHLVQIIGEAARRVSPDFQRAHPEIPWGDVIGIRHKIVHDYMDVNHRILWEVVTLELPGLLAKLIRLSPTEGS